MTDPYYLTREWRALRAACLRRDQTCQAKGCGRPATHADHIVPRRKGGADRLDNLRGLCASCHNRRTGSGNGEVRPQPGCDRRGLPLDPTDEWFEPLRPGDRLFLP